MNGNKILVYSGGTAIAAMKSDEIQSEADLIGKSSPLTGKWKEYISDRAGWSVTVNWLVLASNDVRKLLNVGQTYTLKVKDRSSQDSTGVTGTAIMKVCKITATKGNLVQGSFQFVGTGELT